jgi:hypothetical protein
MRQIQKHLKLFQVRVLHSILKKIMHIMLVNQRRQLMQLLLSMVQHLQ